MLIFISSLILLGSYEIGGDPRSSFTYYEPTVPKPLGDDPATLSGPMPLGAIVVPAAAPVPLEPEEGGSEGAGFSLGPAGGYLRARGSDRGTWTGGVQARLHLGIFAAEASVQVHENEYEHGDVHVTQYPVQLTAFLYPIPVGPVRPYILGGVGWYFTTIDYEGPFASIPNRSEHIFGEHLGAGVEVFFSPRVSLDADVRYIFLNPTDDQVIHRDFNYWQVTFGLNFFF